MIARDFERACAQMQGQDKFKDDLSRRIIDENFPYAIDLLREAGTHMPYHVNRHLAYHGGSITNFVKPRIAFEQSSYALEPERHAITNLHLRIESSLSLAMQEDRSFNMGETYKYREAIEKEILQRALDELVKEREEMGKKYESCVIPLPGEEDKESPVTIEVFIEKPEDWGKMLEDVLQRDRAAALRRKPAAGDDTPPEPQGS